MAEEPDFDPMPLLKSACDRMLKEMELTAAIYSGMGRLTVKDDGVVFTPIPPEDFYALPEPGTPGPNEVLHPRYWEFKP